MPRRTNQLNSLFLRNKTKLTFVNGPKVYNILKAFFIAPQFRKSINMPHESLEEKLRFWTFAHAHSSISNEGALEKISELNTSNFHKQKISCKPLCNILSTKIGFFSAWGFSFSSLFPFANHPSFFPFFKITLWLV